MVNLKVVLVLLLVCSPVKSIAEDHYDDLFRTYFHLGKPYYVIASYLCLYHGLKRSISWLKRRLSFLGLRRKQNESHSNILQACLAIIEELKTSNKMIGYRLMWNLLKLKYNIVVKRETVRILLAVLDPEGRDHRKRKQLHRRCYINKGPNFVWHLDMYDKLAPYGFTIHGCIDGYSRRIMWMEVSPTTHDPKLVATYYLTTVAECEGCPTMLRSDYGTENCMVATSHMALRHWHQDQWHGVKSYKYGKSTTNTRIEGLWSILRKCKTGWWIDKFQSLVAEGKLNPRSTEHRHCLAYVYAGMIEQDIKELSDLWNTHRLRCNRLSKCPDGIPDDLFRLPQLQGTRSYLCSADKDVFEAAAINYYTQKPLFYPEEFREAANALLMVHFGFHQDSISVVNCDTVFDILIQHMH